MYGTPEAKSPAIASRYTPGIFFSARASSFLPSWIRSGIQGSVIRNRPPP